MAWWKRKEKIETKGHEMKEKPKEEEVCTDPNCPDKDIPNHTHNK